jgi:hypothetical protein
MQIKEERTWPAFFSNTYPPTDKTDKTDRTLDDDNAASSVSAQPSPELLNRVGHNLLLTIATGQGGPLQAAAGALDRLGRLLPDASAEGRLIAVLMSLSIEPTSPAPPTDQSVDAGSPPARVVRQGRASKASKTDKAVRPARKGMPASTPVMDSAGRLQASRRICDVNVVSQATARHVLELTCSQMLKLENQKLLQRIQEGGSRLVFYSVAEVQRLLDLVSGGREPGPSRDGEAKA